VLAAAKNVHVIVPFGAGSRHRRQRARLFADRLAKRGASPVVVKTGRPGATGIVAAGPSRQP